MRSQYISQLPQHTLQSIQSDVTAALSKLNLTPSEYQTALQDALDSRLSDLSDLININKYLH